MLKSFIILGFALLTFTAQAEPCCAHWGADGVCHHEYTCSEPTPAQETRTNDDRVYTRNEDGDLTRSCCAHWGADNVCHHEYQC